MSKAEVSRLVKEIWIDKAVRDGERGSKQSMEEFVHFFFMVCFVISTFYKYSIWNIKTIKYDDNEIKVKNMTGF